jgi:hypothetical protein
VQLLGLGGELDDARAAAAADALQDLLGTFSGAWRPTSVCTWSRRGSAASRRTGRTERGGRPRWERPRCASGAWRWQRVRRAMRTSKLCGVAEARARRRPFGERGQCT